MTTTKAPDFGTLLAPVLGALPGGTRPRFLAMLERGAADRYRTWAEMLPEHAELLLGCAASEDEIADRIDATFDLDEALRPQLEAALPAAIDTYVGVFDGLDVWDQLAIQADAERQGARAWRNIAAALDDPSIVEALEACSTLEESSADRLDALLARRAARTE